MAVIFDCEQRKWDYFFPPPFSFFESSPEFVFILFCGHVATTIKVTTFRTIPMK